MGYHRPTYSDYLHKQFHESSNGDLWVWSHRRSVLKNGKPGKSYDITFVPYTVLRNCSRCGRLGKKNGIHSWGIWDTLTLNKQILKKAGEPVYVYGPMCISCANKLRPYVKARNSYIDTCNIINQTKRLISENKNGN